MTQGPQRLIDSPEFAELFEGVVQEQGRIEGLPESVRRDVAAMVSASIAGAAGVAALGAVASSGGGVSASGGAAASGAAATGSALSTTAGGGVVASSGAVAAAGGTAVSGVAASGSIATASGAALGTGVASTAAVASAASGLSLTGGFGAASASLAALGVVPKFIAAVSLVGAVAAGGVAVTREAPSAKGNVPATVVEAESSAGFSSPRTPISPSRAHRGVVADAQAEAADDVPVVSLQSLLDEAAGEIATDDGEPKDAAEGVEESGANTSHRAPGPGLAGEVSLLQKARASMGTDPERAWAFLNTYQQRYPQGALRAEYETLVKRVQLIEATPPVSPGKGP